MNIVLIADRPHGDRVERELRALGHEVAYVQDVHGAGILSVHRGVDWVIAMILHHSDCERLKEKARACGARFVHSPLGWMRCRERLQRYGFPFTAQLELGTTAKETTVETDGQSFRVLLTPAEEGGFVVSVPGLPGCITEGDTESEALAAAREAIEGYRQARRAPAAALAVVPPQPPRSPFVFGGRPLRYVLEADGSPWFRAADVCAHLELGNVSQALAPLDVDERGLRTADTPGGPQGLLHVSEPGLYRLVMVSRKPEARAFQRWVTHEVLPAIRRTGVYAASAAASVALDLRDPAALRGLLAQLAQVNLEQGKALAAAQTQLAEAAPKLEAWGHLMDSTGLVSVTLAGKAFGVQPLKFFDWMLAAGHLYRNGRHLLARQDHVDAGRMQQTTIPLVINKEQTQEIRAKLTGRGMAYFAERLDQFREACTPPKRSRSKVNGGLLARAGVAAALPEAVR